MSIFGVALRGFGKALAKSARKSRRKRLGLPAETNKQMRTRLKTYKSASEKNKLNQDISKTVKDVKKASERAVRLTGKIGLKKD